MEYPLIVVSLFLFPLFELKLDIVDARLGFLNLSYELVGRGELYLGLVEGKNRMGNLLSSGHGKYGSMEGSVILETLPLPYEGKKVDFLTVRLHQKFFIFSESKKIDT